MWFTRLMWFSKFRQLGKANALGLIAGAIVYVVMQSGVNDILQMDALSFEAFVGGTALSVAVLVTKLFRALVSKFPFLQKMESKAEDILQMVPTVENDDKKQTDSTGPESGNYNKKQ